MSSKIFNISKVSVNIFCVRAFSSKALLERKIPIPGDIEINYVQSGHGEKNILLLPGTLGSSWTDFRPQIELLPKLLPNYTIIAWDPPGCGKSKPSRFELPLNYINTDAACANQLMIELDRPKYSVFGWSVGAITALIIAGTYQDAVEKLVVWGAKSYLVEGDMKILEYLRDLNKLSSSMKDPLDQLYGREKFAKMWTEWINCAFAIYSNQQLKGNLCKQEVERIIAPTLILHGMKDPMVAKEHYPYLKERINGCKFYEFPNGKHNIHLRYPDEFNKVVADFIKS